ncbi:hypothetical protein FQN57_003555 [Myotisia sp. PD_48]|nr:hypothetical protein FQN57_003555 [Myotisia sp. PD_48]
MSSELTVTFDSVPTQRTTNDPTLSIDEYDAGGDFYRLPRRFDGNRIRSGNSSMTIVAEGDDGNTKFLGSGLRKYLTEDISPVRVDILLVACSFVSGVLDSAAFNAWGSFASMQTGNIIFLALGVSGQPPDPPNRWAKSLIAIGTFGLGVLFFKYACQYLRPLRRSTLLASFCLQTAAILISSILVQTGVVDSSTEASSHGVHWIQVLPLALLAFQAAGQIVTSRLLGLDEIPTLVLTTVICDLLMGRHLFNWHEGWKKNHIRVRRLATLLALFSGAMLSGGLSKVGGLSAPLWLATGVKMVITACWVVWRRMEYESDEEMGS